MSKSNSSVFSIATWTENTPLQKKTKLGRHNLFLTNTYSSPHYMLEVYKQVFIVPEFVTWKSPPSNCSLSQLALCLTDSLEHSNTRHGQPTSWGSFSLISLEQNIDLCVIHKKVIPLSLEQKHVKFLPCVRSSRGCSWYKPQEK